MTKLKEPIKRERELPWWKGIGIRLPKSLVFKAYGSSDTSFRNEMKKAGIKSNRNRFYNPIEFEELCTKIYPPNEIVIMDYVNTMTR